MQQSFSNVYRINVEAWSAVIFCALFYSYDVLLRIAPSVMTHELMQHYGISAFKLSGIMAFYYYIYAPMQMPVGFLMDRYGPRRLLTVSGIVCSFGIYLFSATKLVWVAMLSRFLVGLGSSFAFVGVLKIASMVLPASFFAFVSGSTMALGMFGATVGDHILSAFKVSIGWQSLCLYASLVGLMITFLMYLFIPSGATDDADTQVEDFATLVRGVKAVASSSTIWIYAIVGCLTYTPLLLFAELFGIDFIQAKYHCSHIQASHLNSIIFMGWLIGGPVVCSISDYIQSRKIPLVVGTLGAFICSWVIIYSSISIKYLPVVMLLFGILNSVQVIVFPVAKDLSCRLTTASALALTNMVCMLSGMMQPLIGQLLEYTHWVLENTHKTDKFSLVDFQVAYLLIPIFMIISMLLLFCVKDSYIRDGQN
ncbi:MFS transporter [Gammaproteobacteria bacterium]|nr:MFS transporter [Gammaproteobacteria bacterium]